MQSATGRKRHLGTYKYYNMDQVVGQALAAYKRIEEAERGPAPGESSEHSKSLAEQAP